MKEICLGFKNDTEMFVFTVGRSMGDLGGIAKDIRKDGDSIVILDEDGEEKVFPNAKIVWYVDEPVVKLEIVQ